MAKLVSTWHNVQSLPENYVFPPGERPGDQIVPICKTIPVVDLAGANAAQEILKASQEFGFFQVIRHGVPESLINDMTTLFKDFFDMAAEDKASLYTEDPKSICKLFSSSVNYRTEKFHMWRDTLRHPCHPLEQHIQFWPEKPTRYREVVRACSVEVRKLSLRLLELIGEGLGLDAGFFGGEISESMVLSANYYPPCPEPSLALGISKHSDPSLLTILHQDEYGLQVFQDGEWIGIEPIPNAFVVNIGYQLQIISNDKLKSAEHRGVANSSYARRTVVFLVNPSDDSIIEPAKSQIDSQNPPLYRAYQFKEFLAHFVAKQGSTEETLKPFMLQA